MTNDGRPGLQERVELPIYPVYVPSKNRANKGHTIKALRADGVPFFVVVEPSQVDAYRASFPDVELLVLPEDGRGLFYARNWIKQHSIDAGARRHWQLDDNIRYFTRRYRGKRIHCDAGLALACAETFVDRYDNVAVAGLNYRMFVPDGEKVPPFYVNTRVYSCTLTLNAAPFWWRLLYNDDTDMCLQALAAGWCTININAFPVEKIQTMQVKGGNTTDLYQGDGRLLMARSLERVWPGVVKVIRRYGRPQHHVNWSKFTTPLRLRPDIVVEQLPAIDELGMQLIQRRHIRSDMLRELVDDRLDKRIDDAPADLLDTSTSKQLDGFLALCRETTTQDVEQLRTIATQTQSYLSSDADTRQQLRSLQELERRWYDSLAAGAPAYDVYADDLYLADLWACWSTYSRRYLRDMRERQTATGQTIVEHLGDIASLVDVGCGIGYSTAGLRQIYPTARIVGTNVEDAAQTRIARRMGERYNFDVVSDLRAIAAPVDLVFASEYFEHFVEPVAHLREIIERLQPRALLVANSFATQSIGHFPAYMVDGLSLDGAQTSRAFSATLTRSGYRRIKTNCWNNRPAYWTKS